MKTFSQSRTPHAFTLIELAVVTTMIAVLVAMILPAFAKAKVGTHRFKCASNLKNIGLAFRIFATDNGDRFPQQLSFRKGEARNILTGDSRTNISWPSRMK